MVARPKGRVPVPSDARGVHASSSAVAPYALASRAAESSAAYFL